MTWLYNFGMKEAKFSKRGLDSKIGLDRYSVPDLNLENYRPGDRVIAIINDRGDKERATIKFIDRKNKRLKVKTVTGLTITLDAELVIKPKELHPVQWATRWAEALAAKEASFHPEEYAAIRNFWRNEFRWTLDWFRLSFGGRVMIALGQEYVGLTDQMIMESLERGEQPAETGPRAELTMYNCYVGENPRGATGYWSSMDKKELYTPKSVRFLEQGKNVVEGIEGSKDARQQFLNVLANARKEAHIMRRGGGYGINISYIETVTGAGITKEDVVIYVPESHRDYQEALNRKKLEKFGIYATVIHTEKEYQEYLNKGYSNVDVQDSVDGLFEDMESLVQNSFDGKKTVLNFSGVRYRNAIVVGINGRSSGSVSWAEMFELWVMLLGMPVVDAVDFAEVASAIVHLIQQGGSRRGALMEILETFRRDILQKFIERKKEKDHLGKGRWLTGANISLGIDDKFMEMVKTVDQRVQLMLQHLVVQENVDITDEVAMDRLYNQSADLVMQNDPNLTEMQKEIYDLWRTTIKSAWTSAEPGVVWMERYNNHSNSWYFHEIVATNPCGEQGLPEWGVCNLAHIVLPNFWDRVNKRMMWEDLERSVRNGIRIQDLIIDITPYFLPENLKVQLDERRIGQGTMGLGSLLIMAGIRYGEEAVDFINELFSRISFWQNDESANLAAQKGAFPKYEFDKFIQSGHMANMLSEDGWKKYIDEGEVHSYVRKLHSTGQRNVTVSTQAPTGSTGTMLDTFFKELGMFDVTTGIEPFFDWTFWRAGRLGLDPINVLVTDQFYAENGADTPLPDYFVNAMTHLQPEDHIHVQAAVQFWTDSSISKTANCPSSYTIYQTHRLYMFSYDKGLKGMTIYRDGSRDAQVLATNKEDAKIEAHIEAAALAAMNEGDSYTTPEGAVVRGIFKVCGSCGEKAYDKNACFCHSCKSSHCGI